MGSKDGFFAVSSAVISVAYGLTAFALFATSADAQASNSAPCVSGQPIPGQFILRQRAGFVGTMSSQTLSSRIKSRTGVDADVKSITGDSRVMLVKLDPNSGSAFGVADLSSPEMEAFQDYRVCPDVTGKRIQGAVRVGGARFSRYASQIIGNNGRRHYSPIYSEQASVSYPAPTSTVTPYAVFERSYYPSGALQLDDNGDGFSDLLIAVTKKTIATTYSSTNLSYELLMSKWSNESLYHLPTSELIDVPSFDEDFSIDSTFPLVDASNGDIRWILYRNTGNPMILSANGLTMVDFPAGNPGGRLMGVRDNDGDGLPETLSASYVFQGSVRKIELLVKELGSSTPIFRAIINDPSPNSDFPGFQFGDWGDIDGDGDIDLVYSVEDYVFASGTFIDQYRGQVRYVINNGALPPNNIIRFFDWGAAPAQPIDIRTLRFFDLDRDGASEVVFTAQLASATTPNLLFILNSRRIIGGVPDTRVAYYLVADGVFSGDIFEDLDGDGRDELFIGSRWFSLSLSSSTGVWIPSTVVQFPTNMSSPRRVDSLAILGSRVQLFQSGNLIASKFVGATGEFEFSGLTPGNYQLLTLRNGFDPSLVEVVVPAGAANTPFVEVSLLYYGPASPGNFTPPAGSPNDYSLGNLWGMLGSGLNMPSVWGNLPETRRPTIAVLDEGIDEGHPDLIGNIWSNTQEIPNNNIDDDGNFVIDDTFGAGFAEDGTLFDTGGHGTHVSGTIGAKGGNTFGVVGVAPNAKILPIKVLTNTGGSISGLISGLDYLLRLRRRGEPVRVANMSLGAAIECPAPLRDVLQELGNEGVLVVTSAGNGGADAVGDDIGLIPQAPAGCGTSNLIVIANLQQNGTLAPSSNFGSTKVDVGAPGTAILSTIPDGQYGLKTGTSMASPHVAGLAGLLFEEFPGLTPSQARDILNQTARPVASLNGKLKFPGIVDGPGAIARARQLSQGQGTSNPGNGGSSSGGVGNGGGSGNGGGNAGSGIGNGSGTAQNPNVPVMPSIISAKAKKSGSKVTLTVELSQALANVERLQAVLESSPSKAAYRGRVKKAAGFLVGTRYSGALSKLASFKGGRNAKLTVAVTLPIGQVQMIIRGSRVRIK